MNWHNVLLRPRNLYEELLRRKLISGGGVPAVLQTVTGISPLTLLNVASEGIKSLTQFGKCEQASTPTPSAPVDIKCNNGAIKVSANLLNPTTVPNENKYINATNGDTGTPWTGTFRHSNYIRIVGGETYHFGMTPYAATSAGLAWYSTSNLGAYISGVSGTNLKNAGMVTTAPANANYVRFSFMVDAGYDTDWQNGVYICVNGSMSAFHAFGEVYVDGTDEVLSVCGKNIFDQSWFDTDVGSTITYKTYDVPNGTYTMSTNLNRFGSATCNVFIGAGTSLTASSANNGVSYESPRTITVTNGKYTVAYRSKVSDTEHNPKDFNWQLEQGSTATDYEPYTAQTASVENLLGVGDYKDEQNTISGAMTRACGIKVLDGTEEWTTDTYGGYRRMVLQEVLTASGDTLSVICSHYASRSSDARQQPNSIFIAGSGKTVIYVGNTQNITTVDEFKAFLAAQYANGTPVVIVYPLAEATTEQVTGQHLTARDTATITAQTNNISDITLEVQYWEKQNG